MKGGSRRKGGDRRFKGDNNADRYYGLQPGESNGNQFDKIKIYDGQGYDSRGGGYDKKYDLLFEDQDNEAKTDNAKWAKGNNRYGGRKGYPARYEDKKGDDRKGGDRKGGDRKGDDGKGDDRNEGDAKDNMVESAAIVIEDNDKLTELSLHSLTFVRGSYIVVSTEHCYLKYF